MSTYQFVLPKMGESITEATILSWKVKVGDKVEVEDTLLEVATDKVDSDVPSPVSGVVKEIKHQEGAVIGVGDVLAIIETEENEKPKQNKSESENEVVQIADEEEEECEAEPVAEEVKSEEEAIEEKNETPYVLEVEPKVEEEESESVSVKAYSPLVMNIAKVENISLNELNKIKGTGAGGRVSKEDVLSYLKNRKSAPPKQQEKPERKEVQQPVKEISKSTEDEIIEMDRMRKLIAKNMLESKKISPHVTSIIEADMTHVVNWRAKNKKLFEEKYGVKLTYMPFIVQAIAKAILEFPMINISVVGEQIIKKRRINIGVATALPSGNLIVPVIKDADRKNLIGIAKDLEELVEKARTNKLKPDDIDGGTYTISNIGSFGNVIGTPIIVQPQVAILAVGAIEKKPCVVETPDGDMIAIRHKMFLSHTYDHRVVDGMLGGLFVKKVAEFLNETNW